MMMEKENFYSIQDIVDHNNLVREDATDTTDSIRDMAVVALQMVEKLVEHNLTLTRHVADHIPDYLYQELCEMNDDLQNDFREIMKKYFQKN